MLTVASGLDWGFHRKESSQCEWQLWRAHSPIRSFSRLHPYLLSSGPAFLANLMEAHIVALSPLLRGLMLSVWRGVQAYRVPELSLSGPTSIFTGVFWQQHGLTVADCISWGIFLHAVLHVVKDLFILQLLSTPSAVRCANTTVSAWTSQSDNVGCSDLLSRLTGLYRLIQQPAKPGPGAHV
jgi:hypothetical protein